MAEQYTMHTVTEGDTIQSIGLLYGVDWTKLVTVNGLEYPYINCNVTEDEYTEKDTVANIGSKLVIPFDGIQVPNKTNNSSKEIEKYNFGCDLDLFSSLESANGVINLESSGELTDNTEGDVRLSEGINNLRQQLILRLGTPKGTLLLHPDFGSNILDYIGGKTTVERLIKIKLEVQESILSDFRVLAVSNITVEFKKGGVFVDCVVHPDGNYSVFKLTNTFYK